MLVLKKGMHRKIHDACNRMWQLKFHIIAAICLLLILWKINRTYEKHSFTQSSCEPIDVVYTWVNGSDPDFIASVRRHTLNYDPARFDDKQELRFSLRSLELYAPWIRNVYIVTNGQIPHWLDLSYGRVTVVPHSLLASSANILPTFSSAAIETMIHRIPGLSKRFLYLNDDIFLGAPLYPDDLYTDSGGVHIFNAWTVPDCAIDCPWVYIGDGACDAHCNIDECQFDGGDCELDELSKENLEEDYRQVQLHSIKNNNTKSTSNIMLTKSSAQVVAKHRNLTTLQELQRIVRKYNKDLKQSISSSSTSTLGAVPPPTLNYLATPNLGTSKDIYSQSLLYTNVILNHHYGFRSRNVPAHVGFLLDRDIVCEMQQKFRYEFEITASHRMRASNDLQFAFMYYSYVMSETYNASVAQIFDEFDTDASLTWSDREVRNFLTRIYPLPLDWTAVNYFEEVVWNCSGSRRSEGPTEQAAAYSTLVYERYEDSFIPTITRKLIEECGILSEALLNNFATRPKYKFSISNSAFKPGMHNNFMMLTSNVTDVVNGLDRIRHKPKKFNCINDNLDSQYVAQNELIRNLLEDFYLSFLPRRSRFELPAHYRNRFKILSDYKRWQRHKTIAVFVGYGASVCLILFLTKFGCLHKAKFVRRYVQKL